MLWYIRAVLSMFSFISTSNIWYLKFLLVVDCFHYFRFLCVNFWFFLQQGFVSYLYIILELFFAVTEV